MHYHNTAASSGPVLDKYESKAVSQEVRLLAYFENVRTVDGNHILLTPAAALELIFTNSVPITSVRRALSNLTRDGKLYKSESPVMSGQYGRPVHYWRLVERPSQRELF